MKKRLLIRGDLLLHLFEIFHVLTFPSDPLEGLPDPKRDPERISWAKTRNLVRTEFEIDADAFARSFAGLRCSFQCTMNFLKDNQDVLQGLELDVRELLSMRGLNQGNFHALVMAIASERVKESDLGKKRQPQPPMKNLLAW